MIASEELAAWLGLEEGSAAMDLATRIEARVVDSLQRVTGRYFGPPQLVTERLHGNDGTRLWLTDEPRSKVWVVDTPARTISSVTLYSSTLVTDDTTELIALTDYETDGRALIRKRGWPWPLGSRNVEVIYERGYPAGNEPGEIQQLVLDFTAARYRLRGTEHLQSKKVDDLALTYREGDLLTYPGAREIILRWKGVAYG